MFRVVFLRIPLFYIVGLAILPALTTHAEPAPTTAPAEPATPAELAQILKILGSRPKISDGDRACDRLAALGPQANSIISDLDNLLEPAHPANHLWAVKALRAIHTPETIPVLIRAVNVRDTSSGDALEALVAMGAKILPTLKEMSHDPSPIVAEAGIRGLGEMGADAIPALEAAAKDPRRQVKMIANDTLLLVKAQFPKMLTEVLRSAGAYQRNQDMDLIARLGSKALDPALVVAGDRDPLVRDAALGIVARIAQMGKGDPAITATLRKHVHELGLAANGKDPNAREESKRLLAQAGGDSKSAAEDGFQSPDSATRLEAIVNVLRQRDVAAAPALEKLAKTDANPAVRSAAGKALLTLPLADHDQRLQDALSDSSNVDARMAALAELMQTDAGNRLILKMASTAKRAADREWFARGMGNPTGILVAIDAINQNDPIVRDAALQVVAEHFSSNVGYPAAQEAAIIQASGKIAPLLGDSSPRVRQHAMGALTRLERYAFPDLLEAIKGKDVTIRRNAAASFAAMPIPPGNMLDPLEAAARDPDMEVRDWAAEAIAHIRDKDAEPALVKLAGDPDAGIRASAVDGLAFIFSPDAEQAINRAVKDADIHVRLSAQTVVEVSKIRQRPAEPSLQWHPSPATDPADLRTVAELMQMLNDAGYSPGAKARAMQELGYHGARAAVAVPLLVKMISGDDFKLRKQAILSLGRMGPASKEALPTLNALLSDEDRAIRSAVVTSLISLGPDAADAVAAVARYWTESSDAAQSAQAILVYIGPPSAAALIQFLHGSEGDMVAAGKALAMIGPGAKDAVPDLIAMIKGDDFNRQMIAMEALNGIGDGVGPAANDAGPALVGIMLDPKIGATFNVDAVRTIGNIRCSTPAAIDALIKALPDRLTGFFAAGSLGQLGPAAKAAVPALLSAVKQDQANTAGGGFAQGSVGLAAVISLGEIGPDAMPALPTLRQLAADPLHTTADDDVKLAIRRIEGSGVQK